MTPLQTDILKLEITIIDSTIARIDQIQHSIRNWTISTWGGSILLVVEHLEKGGIYLMLTALIPVFFGYFDVVWKQALLRVDYRQQRIAKFVNSGMQEKGDFWILDPTGAKYESELDFKQKTAWFKAFEYKGTGWFYVFLSLLSVIFGVVSHFNACYG